MESELVIMEREDYVSPRVIPLGAEPESPVLAGSVIVQNDLIKATDQEIAEMNFSDESFELKWE